MRVERQARRLAAGNGSDTPGRHSAKLLSAGPGAGESKR
jgi:hypothetical protein